MASTSETGHAKNMANFTQLLEFCKGLGKGYNPSRKDIMLDNLQNVHANAQAALLNVINTRVAFNNITNQRRIAFTDLKPFATRITNTLAASGASKLAVDDAKGLVRKLIGRRAGEIKAPVVTADAATPVAEDKQISVSQLSYDNLVDHFTNLVAVVAQQQNYTPNEPELAIDGLQAKLLALNTANDAVKKAITEISNARLGRNSMLYDPLAGMVQLAAGVKLYIKGLYGASSPQYKQISGIIFKNY